MLFFVKSELFDRFDIPDNSIDAMRMSSSSELFIWQGYNGKFYTAGNRSAGWQVKKKFEADSLQILRSDEMRFGS